MIIKRIPAPKRRHYKSYRPFVRRSFTCKCAFCTTHEFDLGGPRFFRIDHYVPRNVDPTLTHVYENLLYTCDICDHFKGNDWHSDPVTSGRGYLDPCKHDYQKHFKINEDGTVEGLTAVAKYMVEHIYLNRGFLKQLRVKRARDTNFLTEYDALIARTKRILALTNAADLRVQIRGILNDLQSGKTLVESRVNECGQCRSEDYWYSLKQVRAGGSLSEAIKRARREN